MDKTVGRVHNPLNIEHIKTDSDIQQVLEELADPSAISGTIERATRVFFFLELVEKRCITEAGPVLVVLLRGDDPIIAMEAERVLKKLLAYMEEPMASKVTEELEIFNQRLTRAIINSRLVEIE